MYYAKNVVAPINGVIFSPFLHVSDFLHRHLINENIRTPTPFTSQILTDKSKSIFLLVCFDFIEQFVIYFKLPCLNLTINMWESDPNDRSGK